MVAILQSSGLQSSTSKWLMSSSYNMGVQLYTLHSYVEVRVCAAFVNYTTLCLVEISSKFALS